MSVLISPYPQPHLLLSFLLIITILVDMEWHLIRVFICMPLMTKDAEHLFMYLLAICVSSLEKCLFRSFAHFLIELFIFLVLSWMSCLYLLEINPLSVVSLLLFCRWWFSFLLNVLKGVFLYRKWNKIIII